MFRKLINLYYALRFKLIQIYPVLEYVFKSEAVLKLGYVRPSFMILGRFRYTEERSLGPAESSLDYITIILSSKIKFDSLTLTAKPLRACFL